MDIFKLNQPFNAFILEFLLYVSAIVVFISAIFILLNLLIKIRDRIKYGKLKNIIKSNPGIGQEDSEGNYIYKQGNFTLKYRIVPPESDAAEEAIEFISLKIKSLPYEENLIRFKESLGNFFIYREWLVIFKPALFFLLLLPILTFYLVLVEPQSPKDSRLRWIIARVLRIAPESVEVKTGGEVKIGGSRRTVVDHQHEPITYTVQPFKWLTFQDEGYISRWRGEPYGYADHSLRYTDRGDIWLEKDYQWREGKLYKRTVNWQEPQGTGIRSQKVLEHDIYSKDKFSTDDE